MSDGSSSDYDSDRAKPCHFCDGCKWKTICSDHDADEKTHILNCIKCKKDWIRCQSCMDFFREYVECSSCKSPICKTGGGYGHGCYWRCSGKGCKQLRCNSDIFNKTRKSGELFWSMEGAESSNEKCSKKWILCACVKAFHNMECYLAHFDHDGYCGKAKEWENEPRSEWRDKCRN
jgi:hypothetical protein